MVNEDVALARIWFLDQDASCPVCSHPNGQMALHMRASDGRPLEPGADWSQINRFFHRVTLDSPSKLAHMFRTGEPVLIPDIAASTDTFINRGWAERERIEGMVGHPLRFRDAIVGVLAVFLRAHPDQNTLNWLANFSAHAAVAIGNCRAFQQIDQLRRQLELERDYLREEVVETGDFRDIVGHSAALARVLQQIGLVAPTDSSVLIEGESGTGKELIARAIHQRSLRSNKPLIRVSCGAIPKELFESEFFGHVKGSFTGAASDRRGLFEEADGGTLFLDEISDLPLALQVKLNRALQEHSVRRVGSSEEKRVDVRVIAATNIDLRAAVAAGKFREDLFYRLNIFPVHLPPVRNRRDDIPTLTALFLERYCRGRKTPVEGFTADALSALVRYDWPGNVRELENAIERALAVSDGPRIGLEALPTEVALASQPRLTGGKLASLSYREMVDLARDRASREYLVALMRDTGGNVTKAAERAGMERESLHRLLKRHGMHSDDFKHEA